MQTMVENYLDLTVDEVYDVITKINVWPRDFTSEMKTKFINQLIQHFLNRTGQKFDLYLVLLHSV